MKRKLLTLLAKFLAGGLVRDIAEGKRGPRLKAIYWRLAGRKTYTGFLLAALAGGMALADPTLAEQVAPVLGTIAAVLVSAGLLDRGWRSAPPPVALSQAWQQVLAFGPALAAVTALLIEWLPRVPGCAWCTDVAGYLQLGVAAMGVAVGYLAARFAEPPAIAD